MTKKLFYENDEYLLPYEAEIKSVFNLSKDLEFKLTNGKVELKDFANGHLYFGLQKSDETLIFREWAPNAKSIFLICEKNSWSKSDNFKFYEIEKGIFELKLPYQNLPNFSLYKYIIEYEQGEGERIPAWAKRVVQDDLTKTFNAQVWFESYEWKYKKPIINEPPLIYEAHIGMSSEEERVSSYKEFEKNVLPRIASLGYNTIQLMAIQEHPYYGSFGYHVSSFFAVSSRFGTPSELKSLIDEAHRLNISVIMDIVHSHAVKNTVEGLALYDGTDYQFFHEGELGNHPLWDSKCFNYSKPEVVHFLLSNCKFWLEEYCFDGYRFDGVTSMCYKDHGLNKDFLSYADYFNDNLDKNALAYLILANKLIKQVNPNSIVIAEDMSGYPGLAATQDKLGIGFDYRLAMAIPDFWIKLIKNSKDEMWNVEEIFWQLTNHRSEEKLIHYAESHDQALVGDKTIMFRLVDAEMYYNMSIDSQNLIVDRGIALHKLIRLITLTTSSGGYLNFMGNEFGHPEWIDFPRNGNNWSYKFARRQWSLVNDQNLKFKFLNNFDSQIIQQCKQNKWLDFEITKVSHNNDYQVISFIRGTNLFVFNFNPIRSFFAYKIHCDRRTYSIILNSDSSSFGGNDNIDENLMYNSFVEQNETYISVYIPARTALVLRKEKA